MRETGLPVIAEASIRPLRPSDFAPVIAVIDEWWGGRPMAPMLPRLFFGRDIHALRPGPDRGSGELRRHGQRRLPASELPRCRRWCRTDGVDAPPPCRAPAGLLPPRGEGRGDGLPGVFENPDAVQLDRARNRHAAFGLGRHRCLGSSLARMELRVALEEWLARYPDFELADPSAVTWSSGQVRGPRTLPVTILEKPSTQSSTTRPRPLLHGRRAHVVTAA
jgi:Cytochrome P450